jgi:hypothetical protein
VVVYLLWHIHHHAQDDNGNVRHRFPEGELSIFEDEGDDVKLLGVYSTDAKAQQRISQAQTLPGFQQEPDCFQIVAYTVDKDEWTTGYVNLAF